MTTNHPNNNNQLRPFTFASYLESENGDCLTLSTHTRHICPAIAWANTSISMIGNYGEEYIFTNIVINP